MQIKQYDDFVFRIEAIYTFLGVTFKLQSCIQFTSNLYQIDRYTDNYMIDIKIKKTV